MTDTAALLGLFLSAFLAATLVPAGSEAVLVALILKRFSENLNPYVRKTSSHRIGGAAFLERLTLQVLRETL